jgi:peptidoglycan/LPS O-acetylase OafA/YrhL
MPRPVGTDTRYIPGLDGIRALAVLAVIAYHLDLPGAGGGLLGVAVFFTLSGYLITGLLLGEWARTGRVSLRRFWLRRLRRLTPAVVAVLAVVLTVTAIAQPDLWRTRVGEAVSALLYVNNWWVIAEGSSYFDLFDGPGPLDHLWSLSIEEQFYVVWPVLVALLLAARRGRTGVVGIVAVIVAVISFALLWHLAVPGLDNTRAYEGTDTRVGGILIGALAAVLVHRRVPGRLVAETAAIAGLAGTIAVLAVSQDAGLGVYRWGILAVSVSTALLSVGVAHSRGVVTAVLGSTPARWIGERSYGLYLWHMPVVALLPHRGLSDLVWSLLVVGLTFGIAELSWNLLEDPIRRYGILATFRGIRRNRIRSTAPTPAAVQRDRAASLSHADRRRWQPAPALALVVTAALSLTAVAGPAGGSPTSDKEPRTAAAPATEPPPPAPDGPVFPVEPGSGPLATSCTSVMHLGDSTSIGLMSENYLPDPVDRIDSQYRLVGVADPRTDISGARSSVEGYQGQPNSTDVASSHVAGGFQGCWVTAIGTNDAANVEADSSVGLRDRVDRTMEAVGGGPVLWLTLQTLEPTNAYYSEEGMQRLNDEILDACDRYPNMRVYDWAAQVRPEWYIDDGIHFTSEGYRERSRRIARALATAFPAGEPPVASCLVRPY